MFSLVTEDGIRGRFFDYDPVRGKVTLEIDYEYLVEFDADKVFIVYEKEG